MIFTNAGGGLSVGDGDILRSVIVTHRDTDTQSYVLFMLTFASSVVSASLGCTKCLKVGVAAIIGDDGPLCSGRFFLAFCGKRFFLQLYIYLNM